MADGPGWSLNFNNKANAQLGQTKALAKSAQVEVKQLGKEVTQASKGGQQAPQALINQLRAAETRLERAQAEIKRQKEEHEHETHEMHDAHDTIRLVGNIRRAADLLSRIANGQATGTEIIRSAIADEKVVTRAAKLLGASPEVISKIGGTFLPIAHAALEGYEFGTAIREKIEQKAIWEDNLDQAIASGKASASLRQVVKDEQQDHPFLAAFGLDNAKFRVENIEKVADSVQNLSADQITAALTAYERGSAEEGKTLTPDQKAHQSRWDNASLETKELIQKNDRGIGTALRQNINKAIREETAREHFELSPETKTRITQGVVQDFIKKGLLTGQEAEQLEKAAKNKKEESPAQKFINHELELQRETMFAIRGKRIPASPTD